ncbi:MAG: NlpC/P60 family protein [Acidobacteriota bacterium]|nr:NlpC/P60 family protein [Acidobacteriota bacterium]
MFYRLLAGLLPVALVAACSSSPPPALGPREAISAPGAPSGTGTTEARRLVDLARSLLETPYRYSGSDLRGFDCSGLTSYLFRDVGLALPRTAESQASAGHWVAPDELRLGDLVFFGESRDKPHHVGLVVSHPGQPLTMIHASSSRGVTQTEITSNSYWLPRLRFGRRVLGAR